MLNLVRPEFFVPVHGEYRMLAQHGRLAVQTGVDPSNVFVVENGDVLEFTQEYGDKIGKTYGGHVLVDGSGVGDVGEAVLRDRKALSNDGIMMVVVAIDSEEARVMAGPDLISKGVFYLPESDGVIDELRKELLTALGEVSVEAMRDVNAVKEHIRNFGHQVDLRANETPAGGDSGGDGSLSLFAVVLSLLSAALYGGADFLGGVAARRATIISVTAISQGAGFVLLAVAAPFFGGHPAAGDLGWGLLGGVFGGIGIAMLYHALSIGKMGVVSPITAVLAAVVPVGVGVVRGDPLHWFQFAGIGCALVAVVMISLSFEDNGVREIGTKGVKEAIISGDSHRRILSRARVIALECGRRARCSPRASVPFSSCCCSPP